MPIYEYTCRKCGRPFEVLVLQGEKGKPSCPACKSRDLEKMISSCAVSSENTRQLNLRGPRKQAKENKRQEDHEYHKRLHDDHHH